MMTGTGPVEIIVLKNQSPEIHSVGKLITIYQYYILFHKFNRRKGIHARFPEMTKLVSMALHSNKNK